MVLITGAFALGLPRWARPDLYPGEFTVSGMSDAMRRAFLHLDFGEACGWPGCPPVHDMWVRGYAADIWLLFGATAIGIWAGFSLGVWCARHTGTRRARFIESVATFLYCSPIYLIGLCTLLLFNDTFGLIRIPYFFDALPLWDASPFTTPWDWFRMMLVPWIITAIPLAAMSLRLVAALVREQIYSDPVLTAIAKGVPRKRVYRRHAGPYAHAATTSLVGVSAPIVVLNLILVEHTFSVPGFFLHTWKATGHSDNRRWPPFIDFEMLTGIAVWGSVFIVVISFATEFALLRIDPRLRSAPQARV